MLFRPWKQLRQYQQLVGLLNQQIELLKQQIIQGAELTKIQAGQVTFLTDLVHRQHEKITNLEKPAPPCPMPLPTVEAVEGLCAAFSMQNPSSSHARRLI